MIPTHRTPSHPGEVLLEEFLRPRRTSQVEIAGKLGVPVQRTNTLIRGKRACSAETALLLSKELGTTPEFWMNLQTSFDLYNARIHLKAA